MSGGDWVAGTYATLLPSTLRTDLATGTFTVAAEWFATLPSGQTCSGMAPVNYVADTAQTIDQEMANLAYVLASRELVPVRIPGNQVVNPDGTVGPWVQPGPSGSTAVTSAPPLAQGSGTFR